MPDELKYPKGINGKCICQECGKAYGLITPAHLKTHNLTLPEYRLLYPDCPISGAQFLASTITFQDSVLFKDKEADPSALPKEEIEKSNLKSSGFPHSVLNLKGVPKNKADILKYLHDAYPYLENNYSIVKKHFYSGMLEYKYTTDMADPVKKVIFDFPQAFWHNFDPYPDHQKNQRLKEDGWIIITVNKHYPTVLDVIEDTDIVSD
jgi:hypothetical protein